MLTAKISRFFGLFFRHTDPQCIGLAGATFLGIASDELGECESDKIIAEHLTDYTMLYDWDENSPTYLQFSTAKTDSNGNPLPKNIFLRAYQ